MTQLEKLVQNVYSAIKQSSGTNTDPAATTVTGPWSIISLLKGWLSGLGFGSVKGKIFNSSAEKTRPANVTAYVAKDVLAESTSVATTWRFENIIDAAGEQGYITKVQLWSSDKAETGIYRIHFFTTSITAINDADPFLQLYANRDSYIGYVNMPAMTTEDASSSTASYSQIVDPRITFVSSTTSIYAMLETLSGFTPVSAATYTIKISTTKS